MREQKEDKLFGVEEGEDVRVHGGKEWVYKRANEEKQREKEE